MGVSVGIRGWGWGSPQMGLQSVLPCLALASDRSNMQALEKKNHQRAARIQVEGGRSWELSGVGGRGAHLESGPPRSPS